VNLLRIKTEIRDEGVRRLIGRLEDRDVLNRKIGSNAKALTREHLAKIALARHDTAKKFGAAPTGHFKEAAESINLSADASGAELRISHRGGLARAVRDVDIKPTGGRKFLTIPITGAAYGKRVYELLRILGGRKLFRPYRKGAGKTRAMALAARMPDKTLHFFYALKESAHQPQDRTLLPSDEEYAISAKRAVEWFINRAVFLRGAAGEGPQ